MMRCAMTGPMPEMFSSSACDAVFTSSFASDGKRDQNTWPELADDAGTALGGAESG